MKSPIQDNIDDNAVAAAIRDAEQRTSGEIRVFVTRTAPQDPAREARRQFNALDMARTPLRNSVLLYFAPTSRGYALVADEAVTFRTGPGLLECVRAALEPAWSEGRFNDAVLAAVQATGLELARHFPRSQLDRDDLPNQVQRD